jgi:hypothetical protein
MSKARKLADLLDSAGDVSGGKIADDTINSEHFVDGGIDNAHIGDLAATKLTGTIADARFPATLPAKSAANLTNIPAANITGTLPAIDGSNLTGVDSTTVASSAPGSPSTGQLWYDTTESSNKVLKVYNGTGWDVISNQPVGSESNPATTIQELYSNSQANGLIWMQITGYNSGNAFQVRYASYASKGWIEILYSKAAYASQATVNHPWGEWVPTSGDGGFLAHNVSSGGLNYSGVDSSSIRLNASGFVATDFALTTKSSVTAEGVTATGDNQSSAYPLTKANVMGNSTAAPIVKILDYFEGSGTSVHIGTGGTTSGNTYNDTDAHFKISGDSNHYEGMFGRRDNVIPGVEWGIDGINSVGSTYAPNWGYRNNAGQDYSGAWAGAWQSGTGAKTGYEIASDNVLSVWLTSM